MSRVLLPQILRLLSLDLSMFHNHIAERASENMDDNRFPRRYFTISQPAMSSEYLNRQRANVLQAPTIAPMRQYPTPPGQVVGMIQSPNHVEYHFISLLSKLRRCFRKLGHR